MLIAPNNSNIIQQETGFVKGFLHYFLSFFEIRSVPVARYAPKIS